MTTKDKAYIWIAIIVGFCIFVYSLSSILLPFVVAIIVSYFLDPAAGKMQSLGISRTLATIIITVLFFAVTISAGVLLVPVLYNQFLNLIHSVPGYIVYIEKNIIPIFASVIVKIDPHALEKISSFANDISGYVLKFLSGLVSNIWSSGMALLNLLSLIFITPVVTFYLLRDWDNMTKKAKSLLPPAHSNKIMQQVDEIDSTLSGYIRGQTNVCLILGIFYATVLTLIGVQFGVFIGLATGILLFLPYIGVLFGSIIGVLVAFFQFGDWLHVGMVIGVFVAGQIIEGVFVTPMLVGNKVGLHPVWMMFGLLAGGALFGFLGVLLAIPVTAVIGVLVRFFIAEYLKSELYSKR